MLRWKYNGIFQLYVTYIKIITCNSDIKILFKLY